MAAASDLGELEAQVDMEGLADLEAQAVSVADLSAAAVASSVEAMEAPGHLASPALTIGHLALLEAALVAVAHTARLVGSVADRLDGVHKVAMGVEAA